MKKLVICIDLNNNKTQENLVCIKQQKTSNLESIRQDKIKMSSDNSM